MRFLVRNKVNDFEMLNNLKTSRAVSAKAIMGELNTIESRYKEYIKKKGNPWNLPLDTSLTAYKDDFISLYETPPVALKFIKTLRADMVGACPMCGRDALGTLDHYLPKSIYYELSFFSRNLIPACSKCNGVRGDLYKGGMADLRPIHCYYDRFADKRIMTITIKPSWRAPLIQPIPYNLFGTEKEIVNWHIENIVIPAGFVEYVNNLWGTLINSPRTVLGRNKEIGKIARELKHLEDIEQSQGHTPNAWKACFYHGLRTNLPVLKHLSTLI